jgi:ABC-type phosphate transport system, periplasmic component
MKKILSLVLSLLVITGVAASCGDSSNNSSDTTSSGSSDNTADTTSAEKLGAISIITREDGSGTRGAFTELFGVIDADKNDLITDSAEVTNSTSVMMTTVAGNKSAIGYVSLGSLTSDVKALKIDGVDATVENIKNGTYKISRPFLVVYKEGTLTDLAKDFLTYILSSDGQAVVSDNGYINVTENAAYTASGLTGTLTLAGSTSVSPLMEKLADAYKALNAGVTIEIQQTGSSAGITSATEGVCDFGMSSRELKDSEAAELTSVEIATDGIAVIVNKQNGINGLTSDQVKSIYLGETTEWSAVS